MRRWVFVWLVCAVALPLCRTEEKARRRIERSGSGSGIPFEGMDVDFSEGLPEGFTFTRDSVAVDSAVQPAVLKVVDEPRISPGGCILIEPEDKNPVQKNTQWVGGHWTTEGNLTPSDDTSVNLYEGHSFKLVEGAGTGRMWRLISLSASPHYYDQVLEFLAYTDGSPVTSADVVPYAGYSGSDPSYKNLIGDSEYANRYEYPATYEHLGNGVYLVWGSFYAVAASHRLGFEVPEGKTVYVSLLTCHTLFGGYTMSTTEYGHFPRTLIPNTVTSVVTRKGESLTHPADEYVGLAEGTIDVSVIEPCNQKLTGAELTIFEVYKDANNYMRLQLDPASNKQVMVTSNAGDNGLSGLVEFENELYVGTGGGRLLKWDGASGWVEKAPKLGTQVIHSLAVHDGAIFAGTYNQGKLYRWNGEDAWVEVAGQLNSVTSIVCLASFKNKLYGLTSSWGRLYEWNGENAWVQKAPQVDGQDRGTIYVWNNKLYFGTQDESSDGARLYEWNEVDAWVLKAGHPAEETFLHALCGYNGKLYAVGEDGYLFEWNGVDAWAVKASPLSSQSTRSLLVYQGRLYAGTSGMGGGRIFRWNDVDAWEDMSGSIGERSAKVLIEYNNKLYSGISGYYYCYLYVWDGSECYNFEHAVGGTARVVNGLLSSARKQGTKLRVVYSTKEFWGDYLRMYGDSGGGWSEIGHWKTPLGGKFPAGGTIYFGSRNDGTRHWGGWLCSVSTYDEAMTEMPSW